MAISKVVFDGKTLIDLTGDTVTPQTLLKGATAHNLAGEKIVGTMESEGGGSGIIDVTELPTENIDENAVYRVTENHDVVLVLLDATTVVQTLKTGVIDGVAVTVVRVDTLPDEMETSTVEGGFLYLYVLNTTGIGYVNLGEAGGVITAGQLFGVEDRGWTDYVELETSAGIYAYDPPQTVTRYAYFDGDWAKIEAPQPDLRFIPNSDEASYSVVANKEHILNSGISIPSEHNGLPVTGATRFANQAYIRSIVLPDSIATIREYAFTSCSGFGGFTDADDPDLPGGKGITSIGDNAFDGCCLLPVTGLLMHNVRDIGNYAFF